MKKTVFAPFMVLFALLVLALFPVEAFAGENTIADGIYAGDIYIGGKTEEEASDAIDAYVNSVSDTSITLFTVGDEPVVITPRDVDFSWSNRQMIDEAYDIGRTGNVVSRYKTKKDLERTNKVFDIEYTVDDRLVKRILTERCSIFDVEAVNGSMERVDDGFVITGGVAGEAVDVEASAAKLEHFLCSEWTGEDASVFLSVVSDAPNASEADLALVRDVLGTFSTSFKSSNAARSQNIRNGASLINGKLIYPGEEFSFYSAVAPITYANGYDVGQAYYSGRVVDSVGGGICQVSTTLYNAVLYAELDITERHNHGMTVSYVDPGRDATIAESSGKDFRFVNNTDAPIYIDAYTTDEKNIVVTLYGHETRSPSREVTLESEILSTTAPENDVILTDAAQPVGYISTQGAHTGYKAKLWKTVTENGTSERTEVNTSSYSAAPRYITVGVATADPNIQAVMAEAIASGDVETVKSTAAACKALAEVPVVELPELQDVEPVQ